MKRFWSSATTGERTLFIILCLFFLVVFLSEYVNGRFWLNDFRVYYDAAGALLNGETIYGEAFGLSSGFYKYAPIALLPFIPFNLLSFETAAIIFYFILSGCYLLSVFYIPSRINSLLGLHDQSGKRYWTFLLFTFLIIASHCHRELHLGNINIILLILAFTAYYSYQKGGIYLSAVLIGIIVLFKPHFVIILLLLALWQKWKVLFTAFGVLVVGLLLPVLWLGVDGNFSMLGEWGGTMLGHSENLEGSVNTIYFYPVKIYNTFRGGDSANLIALASVLLAGVVSLITHFRFFGKADGKIEKERLFMYEFFVVLALIPSLSVTDTEHFVLALPLIVYSLLKFSKSNSIFFKLFFVFACFLYGGDWGDLMGDFSKVMRGYGLLGLGNVLIIITSIHFYKVKKSVA